MRRIVMVILLLKLFIGGLPLFAENSDKVISLDAFIKAYLDHSYPLRMKYEALRKARSQKLLAESADDLTLTAEMGYSFGKDINSISGTQANLYTGKVGLSKQFSASGTIIQLADSFGTGKVLGSNSGANNFNVSVIQPVLRNFFGYMSRIPIAQAALVVKAAELDYQESIETAVQEALQIYLQWIFYYNERSILKQIISNNEGVFRETRAQLQAGIAEVSDLEIARVSVMQYQQELLSNKANYASIVYQLNDYLPVSMEDIPDTKILLGLMNVANEEINPNYIRSIRALNYLMNSGQLSVDYARNMYLPNLDIVASYGQTDGTASFLGSYNASQAKKNVYIGLQFSMPLFFMQARGQEMQAIAQYENILLQRDQAIRDILRNSKDIQNQLAVFNERLNQQDTLISSLKRQVISQTRQFRRGTLELENLVAGRDSLSNATLNENILQIQSSILYIQYLSMIDRLGERHKSALPEYMQNILDKDMSY